MGKQKELSEQTNDLTKQDNKSTYLNLARIREIETIVETFKDSSLASQFVENKYPKDEDGNIITDATPEKVFNKADMVLCLALGEELGIPPLIALSYGKNLNLKSVKKIEKGKKLGLDYATSLEQIYIWGEGSKEIIYTSIHIVNTALTKAGVTRRILQNGTVPIRYCKEIETGDIVKFDSNVHKDVIINNLPKKEQDSVLNALKENGFIGVNKFPTPTYIAEVELTRYNPKAKKEEVISIPYSSQQAIDAGLLKGIKSDGTESKGKDNWNAHIATHLIKMSTMIGGRIIAPDILNGVYDESELTMVKQSQRAETSTFEDAEIIEETD